LVLPPGTTGAVIDFVLVDFPQTADVDMATQGVFRDEKPIFLEVRRRNNFLTVLLPLSDRHGWLNA
jgi:hypothetical protein